MSASLLIVGEALVDVVVQPDGTRTEHPGGSALNVAVAAARLGAGGVLTTQLGDDAFGRLVREHAAGSGVRCLSMPPLRPTGSATARLGTGGAATYDFDLGWDPATLPTPGDFAAVHAGSIGLALQPGAERVLDLLAQARAARVPVTLDPNVRPSVTPDLVAVRAAVTRGVALSWAVKLSDEDADVLLPGRSCAAVVDEVLAAGPALVALTRGSGPTLLGCGDTRVEVTAPRTEVVDSIGAGDTFMGALLAACARRGWLGRPDFTADELAALGAVAAAAAAITCSRAGADSPWAAELAGDGGDGGGHGWTGVAPVH